MLIKLSRLYFEDSLNGGGYNRLEYLEQAVKTVEIKRGVFYTNIVATQSDGVLVVRYMLEIDATINGVAISKRGPRLTVFREIGGEWKVVAHANFARFEQ